MVPLPANSMPPSWPVADGVSRGYAPMAVGDLLDVSDSARGAGIFGGPPAVLYGTDARVSASGPPAAYYSAAGAA